MRPSPLLVPLLVALAVVAGAGCGTPHSIREGIWKLTFEGQDARTGETVPTSIHKVQVLVDWSAESGDERESPGEVVEVTALSTRWLEAAPSAGDLKPFYGDIAPPPRGIAAPVSRPIALRGGDRSWEFALVGRIVSPERIDGKRFLARSKLEDIALEGRWSMEWIADSDP